MYTFYKLLNQQGLQSRYRQFSRRFSDSMANLVRQKLSRDSRFYGRITPGLLSTDFGAWRINE